MGMEDGGRWGENGSGAAGDWGRGMEGGMEDGEAWGRDEEAGRAGGWGEGGGAAGDASSEGRAQAGIRDQSLETLKGEPITEIFSNHPPSVIAVE